MVRRTSHLDRHAVMAAGLVIISLGLMALALAMLHDGRAALFGKNTTGEVVLIERSRSWDRALVQVQVPEGTTLKFHSLSASSGTYTVGQRVPVRYVNADPALAYVGTSAGLYGNLRNGLIVAATLLAGGFALLRASSRMPVSAAGRPFRAYAAPALLVIAAVVGSVLASRLIPGVPAQSDITDRQREGAVLFAAVGAPPDAHASTPRTDDAYGGSKARVTVAQDFDAPGLFTQTTEWYEKRLAPMGWRIFDRPGRGALSREWCKDVWFLKVSRANGGTTLAPPGHRFNLRVEWRPGGPVADCRPAERQ